MQKTTQTEAETETHWSQEKGHGRMERKGGGVASRGGTESAIDADALPTHVPTHVRVGNLERDTVRNIDGDLLGVSAQAVLSAMSRIPGRRDGPRCGRLSTRIADLCAGAGRDGEPRRDGPQGSSRPRRRIASNDVVPREP
jgi:hypothetical protein